ncbi:MAG: sucrase ferredoxin [Cyanobacteria bacterium J06623_5]
MLSATPRNIDIDSYCRYCSEVSRANGEDPIGTAITAQQWLFIEVPQPWAKNPWLDQGKDLLSLFQRIEKQIRLWKNLRILAIAPDKAASTKDKRHLFFYQQPQQPAAAYRQRHYHIPVAQLCQLVQALIFQPQQLSQFDSYRLPPSRALFVCTHTRYDLACGRFGTPLYRLLRSQYAKDHSSTGVSNGDGRGLSVWQTTHFGGHNFAPTLIDFPVGHFWGHLDPNILDNLIYRRGEVSQLMPYYRGWAGFNRWAQIAERSLWMKWGWAWLSVTKSARIVRRDPGSWRDRLLRALLALVPTIRAQVLRKKLLQRLKWAEVEICWRKNSGIPAGSARLRVEASHEVTSQLKSGENQELVAVQQYRSFIVSERSI